MNLADRTDDEIEAMITGDPQACEKYAAERGMTVHEFRFGVTKEQHDEVKRMLWGE